MSHAIIFIARVNLNIFDSSNCLYKNKIFKTQLKCLFFIFIRKYVLCSKLVDIKNKFWLKYVLHILKLLLLFLIIENLNIKSYIKIFKFIFKRVYKVYSSFFSKLNVFSFSRRRIRSNI